MLTGLAMDGSPDRRPWIISFFSLSFGSGKENRLAYNCIILSYESVRDWKGIA